MAFPNDLLRIIHSQHRPLDLQLPHKLLYHDLWEELYVLGLRSDATLCNREILVGQQPWYSKKACQYRQHRRGTFLTNFNETPFAAVQSDHVVLQFIYADCI